MLTITPSRWLIYKSATWAVYIFLYIIQAIKEVRFMVFNATFNNISAISWQSDLVVEEFGVPGENH